MTDQKIDSQSLAAISAQAVIDNTPDAVKAFTD